MPDELQTLVTVAGYVAKQNKKPDETDLSFVRRCLCLVSNEGVNIASLKHLLEHQTNVPNHPPQITLNAHRQPLIGRVHWGC